MGMQFFYCQGCGTRVTGEDLERGGAQRTSTRVRCAECARKRTRRKTLDVLPADSRSPAP